MYTCLSFMKIKYLSLEAEKYPTAAQLLMAIVPPPSHSVQPHAIT